MGTIQIDFVVPEMKPIFERFKLIFEPSSAKSDIPSDVKVCVWIRMINAFHPTVKPREIRSHFIKCFHPDAGTHVLTIPEKTKVMATHDRIFKGQ
ncbi:hypothetical protein [Thalassospira profundimaris]|jgi:hypothetical protein|uniref:hypothetical protein n=1 Tax=Thalassospira profundimaris TaxID=502049 RepID=UPI00028729D6|nr:hypothetical protein [Thalassospira profundimaris]EKF06937.1 hypothetical protein TH2_17366 [Thalassospira profundimaris WP0211]